MDGIRQPLLRKMRLNLTIAPPKLRPISLCRHRYKKPAHSRIGLWIFYRALVHNIRVLPVFDAEQEDGLERRAALSAELTGQRIPSLLETSRRGGHLWIYLAQPAPASAVRACLLPFALANDVECYPKQDVLPVGGCGSLIRLPLGVHRRSVSYANGEPEEGRAS